LVEFGITSRAVLNKWIVAYRADGVLGLVDKPRGRKPRGKDLASQALEERIYHLEMENAVLKKIPRSNGRTKSAEQKARAVTSLDHKYPVSMLCLVVGLSASTFYSHQSKQARPDNYANIGPVLREVFYKAYRSYGCRRIQAVLKTKYGFGLRGKPC
jgi:transposase-like protein